MKVLAVICAFIPVANIITYIYAFGGIGGLGLWILWAVMQLLSIYGAVEDNHEFLILTSIFLIIQFCIVLIKTIDKKDDNA